MTSHAHSITRACSCAPLSPDRSVTHFGCSCSVALRVITGSRCTFMIRRTLNIARKARTPPHLALRRWRMKSPGGMMDVRVRHVIVRPPCRDSTIAWGRIAGIRCLISARVILGLGCDPFRRHATSGIFALSSWPFFLGRAVEIPRGASAAVFLRFRFRVWSRHHPSQLTPAVCCSVSLSSLL